MVSFFFFLCTCHLHDHVTSVALVPTHFWKEKKLSHPSQPQPLLSFITFPQKTVRIFLLSASHKPKKGNKNDSRFLGVSIVFMVYPQWQQPLANCKLHTHTTHFLECDHTVERTITGLSLSLCSLLHWHRKGVWVYQPPPFCTRRNVGCVCVRGGANNTHGRGGGEE